MAANRMPTLAPTELLGLTKATLADLVWEFAALAASNVDDVPGRCQAIVNASVQLGAPKTDTRIAAELLQRLSR